jgi:hypothetical protein
MTSAMTRRLYVISWLMLGTIAIVYFFTLFQSYRNSHGAQMSSLRAVPVVTKEKQPEPIDPSLSQALARMRDEIKLLKGSLDTTIKENLALKAHIKSLEEAFGPSTASLPTETKKPAPGRIRKKAAKVSAPAPKVVTIVLGMPSDGFADDFDESPLPIAGQSSPKRTLFAVELASGLKEGALDGHWSKLKKKHPKLLSKLQPRGVKSSTGSPSGIESHKLIVGPFENAASAARLCARLNAAGANCEGTVFTGSPIGNIAARYPPRNKRPTSGFFRSLLPSPAIATTPDTST